MLLIEFGHLFYKNILNSTSSNYDPVQRIFVIYFNMLKDIL